MARPRSLGATEEKSEPVVRAYALLPAKGGGWVMRTYLVPADSTLHEDDTVDTFGAAIGRATRGLASEAR